MLLYIMSSKNKNTRNKILSATVRLLESSKGKEVRMSDIAKKAGISRQALYLHFPSRAKLLIATTHYVDEIKDVESRLALSRMAGSGIERLEAYIEAWGNYIPEIHAISNALMTMADTDAAASAAWGGRMQAMREGCAAAITALDEDKMLRSDYNITQATDLMWVMLSVRNWEQLTQQCGWSQDRYLAMMQSSVRRLFVRDQS